LVDIRQGFAKIALKRRGRLRLEAIPRPTKRGELNMTASEKAAAVEEPADQRGAGKEVDVTVDYLPATAAFHHEYPRTETLASVRTDATVFFGVRDRQERDKYEYFLEFDGKRITDTSQTLSDLLSPHKRKAEFHLVEQITPGSIHT
jgi:hypothetical protein